MKKMLLTLLLTIVTVSGFAQERMRFMGMPMDCSYDIFKLGLQEKGFRYLRHRKDCPNGYFHAGNFSDNRVMVLVMTTPLTKEVYSVTISSRVQGGEPDSKVVLTNKYGKYKEYLIKKYGAPIVNDSVDQEQNLTSEWDIPAGKIKLSTDGNDEKGTNFITYIDRLGNQKNANEVIDSF